MSKEDMLASLPNPTGFKDLKIFPQDFEKDDDSNFHVDYVTAASNLRARNYGIPTADRHKTKGIAGRIIPALATTTAVAAGLISLELYKLTNGHDNIEKYTNGFISLALSQFTFSEPMPVPMHTVGDKKFSMWDSFEVRKPDLTVDEFIAYMKQEHGFNVDTMICKDFFVNGMTPKVQRERAGMRIRDLLLKYDKITEDTDVVNIAIDTEDYGDEVELPDVRFYLR